MGYYFSLLFDFERDKRFLFQLYVTSETPRLYGCNTGTKEFFYYYACYIHTSKKVSDNLQKRVYSIKHKLF
jgi:hypothetical protein